jgi:hypothetical protein
LREKRKIAKYVVNAAWYRLKKERKEEVNLVPLEQ